MKHTLLKSIAIGSTLLIAGSALATNVSDKLPKLSGYIQTGYNYGNKYAGDKSTFQMKRMRVCIDKKISDRFDFRTQMEMFSGSKDQHGKSVISVMDAFVNAHVNKAINFRIGQYYLPFGFENYDLSPSSVETIDFSNICYRMICRNPASASANFIDYGRDAGVMLYGDLFHNERKDFDYVSYQLSLTNGRLPLTVDDNKSKDISSRLTFRPIKNLRIIGSYNYSEPKGELKEHAPMHRFQVGAWYFDPQGLTLRGEYAHLQSKEDVADLKEDGAYILAGYKIGKFLPVARWEMYRDKKNKASVINKDMFVAGLTYYLLPKAKLQLNYTFTKYTNDVTVMNGDGHGVALMCLIHF